MCKLDVVFWFVGSYVDPPILIFVNDHPKTEEATTQISLLATADPILSTTDDSESPNHSEPTFTEEPPPLSSTIIYLNFFRIVL